MVRRRFAVAGKVRLGQGEAHYVDGGVSREIVGVEKWGADECLTDEGTLCSAAAHVLQLPPTVPSDTCTYDLVHVYPGRYMYKTTHSRQSLSLLTFKLLYLFKGTRYKVYYGPTTANKPGMLSMMLSHTHTRGGGIEL